MIENRHARVTLPDDALQRREQRYSAFIRNSSEAIWRFELEEPVRYDLPPAAQIDAFYRLSYLAECNDAMARMYGYTRPEELVGLRLDQLLPRSDPANVQYLEAFIAAGHQLVDAESVELTREGKKKYLLNSLRAVIEDGLILRAWGTSRDVTVRREAEEARQRYITEIERLNETLEQRVHARTAALAEANKHLRAFAHTIAHDLRGPLRSMQGFSAMLLEEHAAELNGDAADLLRRIQRAGERMEALVSSVLDYSRTLSADLTLEPISTAALVAEILKHNAEAITRAKATVAFSPTLPTVIAHRSLLSQALENLFTNALKFIPPDRLPHIEISSEVTGDRAKLKVKDNGIGIAPENRERIFGVFQRLHLQSEFPGTGIGLAIVQAAVERMGGTVGLTSEVGAGSVFWIELPAEKTTA